MDSFAIGAIFPQLGLSLKPFNDFSWVSLPAVGSSFGWDQ
jgi:hypothetical protein